MKFRLTILFALTLAAALAAFGTGCSDSDFDPVGNRLPETGLAITGVIDTTFYQVDLKWWGSDTDGDVVGFEYRWEISDPNDSLSTFDLDTEWTFTAFNKKVFNLPVPDSIRVFEFFVRSIDDQGAVDDSPAAQTYPFFNNPPEGSIRFKEVLPDSSWPAISFGWNSFDPDGDSTIAKHLVWIEGREDRPWEFAADIDTVLLRPEDIDTSGSLIFYYQVIDQGSAASPPDSFHVEIWPTIGNVLLVDDYSRLPNIPDVFYRKMLDERLGEGNYTIAELLKRKFFGEDATAAFLESFETVIWYTGARQRFVLGDEEDFSQMALADSGLGTMLGKGGSLFMSSLNALGTFAGLTNDFYKERLEVDTLYINRSTGGTSFEFTGIQSDFPLLSVEGSGLPGLAVPFQLRYTGGMESPDTTRERFGELIYRLPTGALKNQWIVDADTIVVDSFFLDDLLVALDTTIIERDTVEMGFYPAVRNELPGGGRAVIFMLPFSYYQGETFGGTDNEEVFRNLLDWLGAPSTAR